MKIRALEEQVETLQKSNLNIFIPLSDHEGRNTPNYDAIISKLKTQILSLQQEVQRQKTALKKAETEREVMRIALQNEIAKMGERVAELEGDRERMRGEIEELEDRLESEEAKRREKEREAIELRVENKFLKEDMAAVRKRLELAEKKHEELQASVMAVNFSSRIHRSRETKITAIETQELANLKSYIEDLEKKIKEMLAASRQERITLGVKREDLGEEIVRLKKNIDLQLGLAGSEETTKSFLSAYHQANNRVN